MLFESFSFSSLRLLALTSHFIITTFLLWTKTDSLQVTLTPTASSHDFSLIQSHYEGLAHDLRGMHTVLLISAAVVPVITLAQEC
jgi:hypothetical protein